MNSINPINPSNSTNPINPIDPTNPIDPINLPRGMRPALWSVKNYSIGGIFHWGQINNDFGKSNL